MAFPPRNRRSGFTIVELLVAATITVIIVVLLGTMFGSLAGTTSRANQRIDVFRDARAAVQLMERDLSGLVRAQPTAYFALDKIWQDTSTDSYSDPANRAPNRQLFALVATKNAGSGDLCAVGYYCRWDSAKHCYSLYRYFNDSTATYNALQTNGTGNYAAPTTLFKPKVTDDLLASYVWNLQIIPYKSDGTIDATYPLIIDPTKPGVLLPAAIEVSFMAMSPSAARTVMTVSASPSDWMDSTKANYQRLILPNSYEFRTRISL
jgi:type II secretory pathway component PulJ